MILIIMLLTGLGIFTFSQNDRPWINAWLIIKTGISSTNKNKLW